MTIRVLVVDDQPMYRLGVAAILEAHDDISVVGQAGDGEEAVRLGLRSRPDVVLMDVRMPIMNGIEATRSLASPLGGGAALKVIMLTTFDIDDYVFDALQAGASGFMLKDTEPNQLVAAVRTVAAGDALLAPRITRRLIESYLQNSTTRLQSMAVFDALTDREREVFTLMAEGLSNLEIAANLYIAEQTTKSHVSRIMSKLGLRDRVHAVVLGYETGVVHAGGRQRSL